mmetsp:Transcript_24427/g.50007  ORF Transcript_24427/g.50007 Transcript_24427/m.50007 type:complete len:218 (+) Transcript_24427:1401-2054(+)
MSFHRRARSVESKSLGQRHFGLFNEKIHQGGFSRVQMPHQRETSPRTRRFVRHQRRQVPIRHQILSILPRRRPRSDHTLPIRLLLLLLVPHQTKRLLHHRLHNRLVQIHGILIQHRRPHTLPVHFFRRRIMLLVLVQDYRRRRGSQSERVSSSLAATVVEDHGAIGASPAIAGYVIVGYVGGVVGGAISVAGSFGGGIVVVGGGIEVGPDIVAEFVV